MKVADDARFVQATQANMAGTGIGTFNDCIRDAIRGGGALDSGHDHAKNQGFINPPFKNKAFEDEQEARLLFRPAPNCSLPPDFRVGRGMLVPYYSLKKLAAAVRDDPCRPPISSVWIGPNPNREINREGVRLMLETAGYLDASVFVSEPPYRG